MLIKNNIFLSPTEVHTFTNYISKYLSYYDFFLCNNHQIVLVNRLQP